MPFPILEGIQLFNAARGLIHEIKGLRNNHRTKVASQPESTSSAKFADLLNAQLKANGTTKAVESSSIPWVRPIDNRLNELIAQLQARIAEFRNEFANATGGLLPEDFPQLDLTTDSDGHVVVANDHPDKERIDALFAAHPMLEYAFHQLSTQASLMRTTVDMAPFGINYLRNPQASVQTYGELLAGTNSPSQFHLIIGADGIYTTFGDTTTGDADTSADSASKSTLV